MTAHAALFRPDLALALPSGRRLTLRGLVGFVLFAGVGIGAALGASLFHRGAAQGEVAKYELALPALAPRAIEIDLAAQGWPKALVAPATVSFRGRVAVKQPLALRLSLEGAVERGAIVVDGDAAGADRIVHVAPGRKTSIGVVFDVPAARRGEAVPVEAALVVVADGTGRPLGRIPLRVIDSGHGALPLAAAPEKNGHSGH